MTSIVFASGKGGVGKSSISLNLGLLLSKSGKKTVVVDTDISMGNLGLLLGVERTPITLNHVLAGENDILDAIYEGPLGLKYVPAQLSTEKLSKADYAKLHQAILKLEKSFDFVLLDAAPGWMQDAKAAMDSASDAFVIITPEPIALADGLKVKNYLERRGTKIRGILVNMALNDPTEIRNEEIKAIMATEVIARLPEDLEVRRASASQIPVAVRAPACPFMRALTPVASSIAGIPIAQELPKVKKGLLQAILNFFRRK